MLDKRNIEDVLSLTPMQKGLLFNYLNNKDQYNIRLELNLEGEIDINAFYETWNIITEKNEMFRTIYRWKNIKNPVQIILKEKRDFVRYCEINSDQFLKIPKNINIEEYPIIVSLVKYGAKKYKLSLLYHHIVMDGWSLSIILKDFFSAYSSIINHNEKEVVFKPMFKNFVKHFLRIDYKLHILFWKDYLTEFNGGYEIPFKTNTKQKIIETENKKFQLDAVQKKRIEDFCKCQKITISDFFYSVWSLLLLKLGNTSKVIFGTIVSGRNVKIGNIENLVGLLINTIPFAVSFSDNDSIFNLIKYISSIKQEREEFENTPISEINKSIDLDPEIQLFDSILAIENYPLDNTLLHDNIPLKLIDYRYSETNHYDLSLVIKTLNTIEFDLYYNTGKFSIEIIKSIIKYFLHFIDIVISEPLSQICNIEIITKEDKKIILSLLNNTKTPFSKNKTIIEIFEDQAKRNRDRIALFYQDSSISFEQLNNSANEIANFLINKGVKRNSLVGIVCDRSLEMIISIYGILKSGGGYLPIDPNIPNERIRFIINDANPDQIIYQPKYKSKLRGLNVNKVPAIFTNDKHETFYDIKIDHRPNDLIYVIYTSGSTGKPKGTIINNYSLVNRLEWMQEEYPLYDSDIIIQKTTYVFDVSVWEIFLWSFSGAKLFILNQGQEKDPKALAHYYKLYSITVSHFVPSLLDAFCDYLVNAELFDEVISLRYIFSSGEALTHLHYKKFLKAFLRNNNLKLINLYGPTEATIDVSFFNCYNVKNYKSIPIGIPINNIQLYIVDRYGCLLPPGFHGELAIAGVGLARGYLNNVERTHESFVNLLHDKRQKIYLTGDIASWKSNFLFYHGRLDNQLKINGIRIELDEVEKLILQFPLVNDCKVIFDKYTKRIISYIIPEGDFSNNEIHDFLSTFLPNYMIPSNYIRIDKFPITDNGKLDIKRLALLNEKSMVLEDRSLPETSIERILKPVWEEVLGVRPIGINDNFFRLGGDSIKSIQICSRLYAYNLQLEVSDIISNPTIKKSASFVKETIVDKKDFDIEGDFELTPLMKDFLADNFLQRNYFNQAVYLIFPSKIDVKLIEDVFSFLVKQHDMLRARFNYTQQHSCMTINDTIPLFEIIEYTIDKDMFEQSECDEIFQSINKMVDIEMGPLLSIGILHNRRTSILYICIHHFLIDGVSWRILLDDFITLYNQKRNGVNLELPAKTDSFRKWSLKLFEYSKSKELFKEISYWKNVEQFHNSKIIEEDVKFQTKLLGKKEIQFSKEITKEFFTLNTDIIDVNIQEILLGSLALAVGSVFNISQTLFDVETHGRGKSFDGININRTIGWFTSIYPVSLRCINNDSLLEYLITIKEILRKTPNYGIGYQILKYSDNALINNELSFTQSSQICFNYLGQLTFNENLNDIKFEFDTIQNTNSAEIERKYLIECIAFFKDDILYIVLDYNKKYIDYSDLDKFSYELYNSILQILQLCKNQTRRIISPSDCLFNDISQEKLKKLQESYILENVLPLSPSQKDIFVHYINDNKTKLYCEKIKYKVLGNISIDQIKLALQLLISSHEILRSNYVYKGFDEPISIINSKKSLDLFYYDLSNFSKENKVKDKELNNVFQKWINHTFCLEKDILLRLLVCKIAQNEYNFYWEFHHIILDGWSISLLHSEFLQILQQSNNKEAIKYSNNVFQYKFYLEWLGKSSKEKALEFWKDYLLEVNERVCLLPSYFDDGTPKTLSKHNCTVCSEKVNKIKEIIQANNATMGAFFHCIWAIILNKYTGLSDLVFGTVVSGRPSKVANVEAIVGMFTNVIPFRIKISSGLRFNNLLKNVAANLFETEPFHHVSLSEINDNANNTNPLFNHILVFENYPKFEKRLKDFGEEYAGDFQVKQIEAIESTNYDLNIVINQDDDIEIQFLYNKNVYNKTFLEKISECFEILVDCIIENQSICIGNISLLKTEDKEYLLREFNLSENYNYSYNSIPKIFENQVKKYGDRVAVRFQDTLISYNEINMRSDFVAKALIEIGVIKDTIVALFFTQSIEVIVAMLGVLKAGAIYLPIETDQPQTRIKEILKDSACSYLLTLSCLKNNVEFFEETILQLDSIDITDLNERIILPFNGFNHAYLMYTSGSNGKPKGSLVKHTNIIRIVKNTNYIEFNPNDIMLQLSNIVFDGSVFDIYGSLLNGASLVIALKDDFTFIEKLADFIYNNNVTKLFITTALFNLIIDTKLEGLRRVEKILFGGEKVSVAHIKKALNYLGPQRIVHVYGPTESTVFASYYHVNTLGDRYQKTIPIGKPVSGTSIFVLDSFGKMQINNCEGEIYIGGKGLSSGYLNQPELTHEKFYNQCPNINSNLYASGDIGRINEDGFLEYVNRKDNQIKLRGFRIELGEIEYHLSQHPQIKQIVVLLKLNKDQQKNLVCYYSSVNKLDSSDIRQYLKDKLPHYMIPNQFIYCQDFPLTPNGKIDRNELVKIRAKNIVKVEKTREVDQCFAKIWADVLCVPIEIITEDSDFIELGGHSLKIMTLISKIFKQFENELTIRDVYQNSTFKDLLSLVYKGSEKQYKSLKRTENKEYYDLSYAQKRMWVLNQNNAESVSYNMFGVIPVPKCYDPNQIKIALNILISRHESFRTKFIEVNSFPVQKICYKLELPLEIVDLDKCSDSGIDDIKKQIVEKESKMVFDISKLPLFHMTLIMHKELGQELILSMHHIIADGISLKLLKEEFNNILENVEQIEQNRPLQYRDYSYWNNKYISNETVKKEYLNFWEKNLENYHLDLNLPQNHNIGYSNKSSAYVFFLKKSLFGDLKYISLFSKIFSVFNVFFSKLNNLEEIVTGLVVSGRQRPEFDEIMGVFANMLIVKSYVERKASFSEFLNIINRLLIDVLQHQTYPQELIFNHLNKEYPIPKVVFNMPNIGLFEDEEIKNFNPYHKEEVPEVKFEIMIYIYQLSNGIKLECHYNSGIFSKIIIEELMNKFTELCSTLFENSEELLENLISKDRVESIEFF